MKTEYTIGRVSFGPTIESPDTRITELESLVAKLTKHRNKLRRALERCAPLSEDAANERYEAMQDTAP